MEIKIYKIHYDIPEPPQQEFVLNDNIFVIDNFRKAKKGELVYSFEKGKLVQRGSDSRTPFWVVKLKIKIGDEEVRVSDFDDSFDGNGIDIDNGESEIEEFEEFQKSEKIKKCLRETRKEAKEAKKAKEAKEANEAKEMCVPCEWSTYDYLIKNNKGECDHFYKIDYTKYNNCIKKNLNSFTKDKDKNKDLNTNLNIDYNTDYYTKIDTLKIT